MTEFTVKEFAARERVTERTVRNWIDKGAVPVRRTPGGGIRITVGHSVLPPSLVDGDMKKAENRGSLSV